MIGSHKVTGRMPAVFIGHGNPMNAIERNCYTAAWTRLAESLPRPPDHFLPLLYVVAQAEPDERLAFPVDGFDGGSVSMLGTLIG